MCVCIHKWWPWFGRGGKLLPVTQNMSGSKCRIMPHGPQVDRIREMTPAFSGEASSTQRGGRFRSEFRGCGMMWDDVGWREGQDFHWVWAVVSKRCASAGSFAAYEQAVRGGWSLKDGTSSPQTANKDFLLDLTRAGYKYAQLQCCNKVSCVV